MDTVDTIRKALDIAVSLNLPFTAYAKMGFDIFATMREHTGLSTEELIEGAGKQLDENEKRILKNLAESAPTPDTPAVTPAAPTPATPAPEQPKPLPEPVAPASESTALNIPEREKKIEELKARLETEKNPGKQENLRERIERNEKKLVQQKIEAQREGKF